MIEFDMVAALEASTGLHVNVASGDVRPFGAFQNPPNNYITYQLITGERPSTLTNYGSLYRKIRMQINCWSDRYVTAKSIAEAAILALDTATAFSAVLLLESDDEDEKTKSLGVMLDYSLSQTTTS